MSGASVGWASSASSVASVSSSGLVTALSDGTATIAATSGSAMGTASVTVGQVAVSITLSPGSVVLAGAGDTRTITAAALDAGGSAITSSTLRRGRRTTKASLRSAPLPADGFLDLRLSDVAKANEDLIETFGLTQRAIPEGTRAQAHPAEGSRPGGTGRVSSVSSRRAAPQGEAGPGPGGSFPPERAKARIVPGSSA